MGALTRLATAIALLAATPARANTVDRWRPLIAEASNRFGIPTRWIERVMRAESAGLTMLDGRPIRSREGAIGLMQLMPATWADMRARLGLGADPDDPRDNIMAGSCYLRLLYDRFGYPGLFAAYNAGPARYAAYLAGRQRLPSETIAYLATIGGQAAGEARRAAVSPVQTLFLVRRAAPQAGSGPATAPSVFAIVKAQP